MQEIENTFAPHVENKILTVSQIITGLHTRVFIFDKLPPKAKAAVQAKLDKRYDNRKP